MCRCNLCPIIQRVCVCVCVLMGTERIEVVCFSVCRNGANLRKQIPLEHIAAYSSCWICVEVILRFLCWHCCHTFSTGLQPTVHFSKWINVESEALINVELTAWFIQCPHYCFLARFQIFLFTVTLLLTSKLKSAWTLCYAVLTREASRLIIMIFLPSHPLDINRTNCLRIIK